MKKVLVIVLLVITTMITFCSCTKENDSNDYLRIHIRANSNCDVDQEIKYKVRDGIVEYLTPLVENLDSQEKAKAVVVENIDKIEQIADVILVQNGFNYKSNAYLTKEEFPTRKYEDLTLESGEYDAVIVELGEAEGENWWCVVFPPLCFISENNNDIEYRSIIVDMLKKYLDK